MSTPGTSAESCIILLVPSSQLRPRRPRSNLSLTPSRNGSIVVALFFTGGGGTASTIGSTNSFADSYVGTYEIVYVEWASDWEKASSNASNENILEAACRPATLLKWVNGSSDAHPSGAMCAQGKSAGSAAIAYSMSWYGADSYLTNVELLAGPVLTEIDQGCTSGPPNVTMCNGQPWCQSSYGSIGGWTTSAGYTSNDATGVNGWAGISDCGSSSGSELTTLQHMSTVGGQ